MLTLSYIAITGYNLFYYVYRRHHYRPHQTMRKRWRLCYDHISLITQCNFMSKSSPKKKTFTYPSTHSEKKKAHKPIGQWIFLPFFCMLP